MENWIPCEFAKQTSLQKKKSKRNHAEKQIDVGKLNKKKSEEEKNSRDETSSQR